MLKQRWKRSRASQRDIGSSAWSPTFFQGRLLLFLCLYPITCTDKNVRRSDDQGTTKTGSALRLNLNVRNINWRKVLVNQHLSAFNKWWLGEYWWGLQPLWEPYMHIYIYAYIIRLRLYSSIWISIYQILSIYQVCIPVYLYIYIDTYLSMHLSIHLSIYL